MLTLIKLKIFKYYNGEIDNWAKSGTKKEKKIMNDEDWYQISDFIQDLHIIKKGLASSEYVENFNARLKAHCDNLETIQHLKNM